MAAKSGDRADGQRGSKARYGRSGSAQTTQDMRMSAAALEGYYVYVFRDLEGVPRYVGKGTGNRHADRSPYAHTGAVHLLLKSKKHMPVEIVASGLTEEDAYALETETVAKFGRQLDGGTLFNVSQGGRRHLCSSLLVSCRPRARLSRLWRPR